MDAEKVNAVITSKEVGSSESLPKDINFNTRKKIIRDELNKILGRPRSEKQRLKNKKFIHEKKRNKIANASRRKNRLKG